MKELNRQYQLSEPSDEVVFFPTGENGVYVSKASNGAKNLGDVVISLEKAVKTCRMHGVFGLLGYCSISSKPVDRMALRDKVEDIMDLLGLPASPGYAAARRLCRLHSFSNGSLCGVTRLTSCEARIFAL